MFSHLRRAYYWLLVATDISSTVHSCPYCAHTHLRLIRRKQLMRLFPAKQALESVAVNLLGPFKKKKATNHLILVMADRFTEVTEVVPLKRTTGLDVSEAFSSHWAFNYGAPNDFLSDQGAQFERNLCQNTCPILGISSAFTSAITHRQTDKS